MSSASSAPLLHGCQQSGLLKGLCHDRALTFALGDVGKFETLRLEPCIVLAEHSGEGLDCDSTAAQPWTGMQLFVLR
jgi:hypothetical protein